MNTDPRGFLFRDYGTSARIADVMGWSFEDLCDYADQTYDPQLTAFALSGRDSTVYNFNRWMVGDMRLAQRYSINVLEALSTFVSATHSTNKRSPTGGVFPEDEQDVDETAKLLRRIGWSNVAESTVSLRPIFYEPCRESVKAHLDAGVSARFICQTLVSFDIEEALFLEENGVPPEYATGFLHTLGDESHADNIVAMWKAGIPLEYALA